MHNFALDNLDHWVKEKRRIGNVVETNLSKIPEKEISDMIQNFMGKKLKKLNRLGALLGLIAGLILGLVLYFFGPTDISWFTGDFGNSVLILRVLLLCLVSGFIGWFTNVIAVKGIFRPYEKKWLWHGVLPANKEQIARDTGEFVSEKLLKVEELFSDSKIKLWQTKIESGLSYDKTVAFLAKQIDGKKMQQLVNFFLNKNQEELTTLVHEKLANVSLSHFPLDNFKNSYYDFLMKHAKTYSPDFASGIDQFLQKQAEKSMGESLPKDWPEMLSKKLTETLVTWGQEWGRNFDIDALQEWIVQHEKVFQGFSKKTFQQILLEKDTDALAKFFSNWLLEMLSREENIQKFCGMIQEKIGIAKNKTVGDLFDGRLITFLEGHIGSICQWLTNQIIKNANNKCSSLIQDALSELNWWQKFTGKGIVIGTINRIIDDVIPTFLRDTAKEIEAVFRNFIQSDLANYEIRRISDSLNILKQEQLIGTVGDILGTHAVQSALEKQASLLVHALSKKLTPADILKPLQIETLKKLQDKFPGAISEGLEYFHQTIQEPEPWQSQLNDLLLIALDTMLFSQKQGELTKDIGIAALKLAINKVINILAESYKIKTLCDNEFDRMLQNLRDNGRKGCDPMQQFIRIVDVPRAMRNLFKALENIRIQEIFIRHFDRISDQMDVKLF